MTIEVIGHIATILCPPEVLVVLIIILIPAAVDAAVTVSDTIKKPLFRARLRFLFLCEAGCIVH